MRDTLKHIDGFEIINPIEVEVTASNNEGHRIYWVSVPNLKNELVFGVGTTKEDALTLLKELLTDYYNNLMSSDFDRYHSEDLSVYLHDKKYLKRSVCKHN